MIAATIGGPIITERKIPLSMSLKNNHGVCCIIEDKNIRIVGHKYTNFTTAKLINITKMRCQIKLKWCELKTWMK